MENFRTFTFSRKNFRFSSANISDDPFFSHRPQISNFPPSLPLSVHFPLFRENYYFPLLLKIPPLFSRNSHAFYVLFVYFVSPQLCMTMMHLCITQCTYWTPLI